MCQGIQITTDDDCDANIINEKIDLMMMNDGLASLINLECPMEFQCVMMLGASDYAMHVIQPGPS